MFARIEASLRVSSLVLVALVLVSLGAGEAQAHVKWFCAFDVAGQPRGLENVLCPSFEALAGLAIIGLFAGCLLERTIVGEFLLRCFDRATDAIRANTEFMFRFGIAGFLVALWALGGVLLTPELKTTWSFIPWLQLAMAACLMSRRTMPLTALGIFILYAFAIAEYGIFHLADYPIFLGIAAYLALTGLQKNLFGFRPLDVVRWATAITLMWASIEKWAYPEWSFPLFIQHPSLTLGFDSEFVMRSAGVVEFALSFALIWTPLVRRVGAVILAGMFIAAIFQFGMIDAIGHSGIIIVLFAIMADPAERRAENRDLTLVPLGFAACLTMSLGAYYLMHNVLFSVPLA